MFKKFNWGHGILVFYICFVGVIITALVASFSVDHTLVVDDYYAKDLSYQSQYDKSQNSLDSDRIKINNDRSNHLLTIDIEESQELKGYIDFYRPNDKSKDFKIEMTGDATTVNTEKMLPGKWILKIDWTEQGKPFYKEEMIFI